ncbi:MAG: hypothetical protein KC613_25605, partial [Myxococcales bacterium]|nr:hypothetical protein [Myxococcales bacterium]
CDNCHSLPNTWYDPDNVTERKCTLSCVGCHVDPNGGGLRNVSGRYYSENTLPMWGAPHRPLQDRAAAMLRDMRDPEPGALPTSVPTSAPTSGPTSGPVGTVATTQTDPRGPDAPPTHEGPAWGRPLAHQRSPMSWLEGRYGDHVADPLLLVGGDARFGFWNWGPQVFPMQGDLYAAVQPVEHLTVAATGGIRGRSRSLSLDGGALDSQDKVGVRDLWIMTHEWPALSHLRVGRFLPAFGTKVADHTAYIRRGFGLGQEDPANRVIGAEIGANPNYPYLTASAFKPSSAQARDPFETADGWGSTVSGGWRDLAWGVGASGRIWRRPLSGGGDTNDLSLQGYFNPWRLWEGVPLTWLAEVTWGTLQRPLSGHETQQLAVYQQLAWTFRPGLVVRGRYDFWDPDREVAEDAIHRPGLGIDFIPIDGLSLNVDVRAALLSSGGSGADLFAQIHGWF